MNTLICPKCNYTLFGDEPSIETECEVCKQANTLNNLEENNHA